MKLNWIREQHHEVEATTNEDYLLKLFDWKNILLTQGLNKEDLLNGTFIEQQENLIFYGGVGTGKTYLASLIGLNAIQRFGKSIKFYTYWLID